MPQGEFGHKDNKRSKGKTNDDFVGLFVNFIQNNNNNKQSIFFTAKQ